MRALATVVFAIISLTFAKDETWEFGSEHNYDELLFYADGEIEFLEKHKRIEIIDTDPCHTINYVRVSVNNPIASPEVHYDKGTKTVDIDYHIWQPSKSTYRVIVKGLTGKPGCDDPPPFPRPDVIPIPTPNVIPIPSPPVPCPYIPTPSIVPYTNPPLTCPNVIPYFPIPNVVPSPNIVPIPNVVPSPHIVPLPSPNVYPYNPTPHSVLSPYNPFGPQPYVFPVSRPNVLPYGPQLNVIPGTSILPKPTFLYG